MSDWFKTWFESDEYLQLYRHRNFKDAQLLSNLILAHISSTGKKRALDLACGNARHALFLADAGFHTVGIDLSNKLLSKASENIAASRNNIHLVRADIRMLPFKKSFDIITNLFTSFGYFQQDDENFLIFDNAGKLLSRNGLFIFDYFNTTYLKEHLVPLSLQDTDTGSVTQKRSITKGRVEKIIEIRSNGKVREFRESVKLYTADELIANLKEAGLSPWKIFGDYNGAPFDEHNSNRFVALCKKS
jgi:SAM-dependent methyltransferase